MAGLKEEIFPFAITYTEQELGAHFVTDVGTSNFHIVLEKKIMENDGILSEKGIVCVWPV